MTHSTTAVDSAMHSAADTTVTTRSVKSTEHRLWTMTMATSKMAMTSHTPCAIHRTRCTPSAADGASEAPLA